MMYLTGVFFFILQMFRLLLGLKPMDEPKMEDEMLDNFIDRFEQLANKMKDSEDEKMTDRIDNTVNKEPPVSNPVVPPSEPGVEQVLCIPADMIEFLDLKDKGVWSCHVGSGEIAAAVRELCSEAVFVNRPHAEVPASGFIQLIPYCVVIRGREIFCYRRKGSEGRLTGLFSCGVGGHINPVDFEAGEDIYEAALRRELREELGLELADVPPVRALIYDDSNDVGKVHLGIVHVVQIDLQRKLTFNDPALEQGEFWPVSELVMKCRVEPGLYETWTQLVLRKIFS